MAWIKIKCQVDWMKEIKRKNVGAIITESRRSCRERKKSKLTWVRSALSCKLRIRVCIKVPRCNCEEQEMDHLLHSTLHLIYNNVAPRGVQLQQNNNIWQINCENVCELNFNKAEPSHDLTYCIMAAVIIFLCLFPERRSTHRLSSQRAVLCAADWEMRETRESASI